MHNTIVCSVHTHGWAPTKPLLTDRIMAVPSFLQNDLPDKLYFRIGEVSELAGVPTYVLRFWESEFTSINPKRTPAGQRLYRQRDVKAVLFIKHLLYDQKFTIKGARQYLKLHGKSESQGTAEITFDEIYRELRQIRDMLK